MTTIYYNLVVMYMRVAAIKTSTAGQPYNESLIDHIYFGAVFLFVQ